MKVGTSFLGAYVISKPTRPSDILLVKLFQREAAFILALRSGKAPNVQNMLRVVPMFETMNGLETAPEIMDGLLGIPWYRQHQ